jgi:hypothetical protein
VSPHFGSGQALAHGAEPYVVFVENAVISVTQPCDSLVTNSIFLPSLAQGVENYHKSCKV